MKRFCFPLRPVAVLRAHQELRARELFSHAVHTYVRAEEELAGARVRTAALAAALHQHRLGTVRAAEASDQFAAYRRECDVEIQSERAMHAARAEMERHRALYVEAHRKLQVVQRLEEKARAAHRLAVNHAEQAEFDDFAGRRLSRLVTGTP